MTFTEYMTGKCMWRPLQIYTDRRKEQKLKRNRMEHEKKIDTANHYDCLETDVREDARKNFKRQPYKSVDVAQYIAKKFGIGGDADGRRTENHE